MKKNLTVQEMGKRGGDSTKNRYGVEHYKRISKIGLEKRWNKDPLDNSK